MLSSCKGRHVYFDDFEGKFPVKKVLSFALIVFMLGTNLLKIFGSLSIYNKELVVKFHVDAIMHARKTKSYNELKLNYCTRFSKYFSHNTKIFTQMCLLKVYV